MLQSLLDEYHRTVDSLTEKDRAILERRLWVEVKKKHGSKYPSYHDWVKTGLGKSMYGFDMRMALINNGDWVDPLWKRVDGEEKMTLATAAQLSRSAKRLAAETGKSNAESLKLVLEEYDSDENTYFTRTPDGKMFRRRRPKRKVTKPKKNGRKWEVEVKDSKTLWALLDSIFSHFLANRLKGLDESVRQDLTKDFVFQLRAVYEDLLKEVVKLRRDMKLEATIRISAYKLRQACEALGVATPKKGGSVDMQEAKARYRRLAARFHPDANSGREDMVKQYHAVNEAWETIKKYQECLDG